jgi:hypothetical protein
VAEHTTPLSVAVNLLDPIYLNEYRARKYCISKLSIEFSRLRSPQNPLFVTLHRKSAYPGSRDLHALFRKAATESHIHDCTKKPSCVAKYSMHVLYTLPILLVKIVSLIQILLKSLLEFLYKAYSILHSATTIASYISPHGAQANHHVLQAKQPT